MSHLLNLDLLGCTSTSGVPIEIKMDIAYVYSCTVNASVNVRVGITISYHALEHLDGSSCIDHVR